MSKFRRIFAVTLAYVIMACTVFPAFAGKGFIEGPTTWLQGNGTNAVGNIIVATGSGGNLFVGGSASFKTTGSVNNRAIRVTINLYDVQTGYRLGTASKMRTVSCNGAMAATGYYDFKGNSFISYTTGQRCRYEVTREYFTDVIWGRYKAYLTDEV